MSLLRRAAPPFRIVLKLGIVILAIIGAFTLVPRLIRPLVFEDKTLETVKSPDGKIVARLAQTVGPTVQTTRVLLEPKGAEGWIIYQTKDSDYTPTLRWLDQHTLLVGLGCERFDYVSNPDDWERSDKTERRLKVRYYYADKRCDPAAGGNSAP